MTALLFSRAALILILSILFTLLLGSAVTHGWFAAWDYALEARLVAEQGVTSPLYIHLMQWVSWIGGGFQRYLLVGGITLWLWRWRGVPAAIAMAAGALLSSALANSLKYYYLRPRPDLIEHLDLVHNPSYPSGHATNAAFVYLLLALLTPARHRTLAFGVAGVLTFATGLSRINLGVHWPSDVLAGWVLGAGCAVFAAYWVSLRDAPGTPRS